MAQVAIRNVSKSFGSVPVLHDVSVDIPDGAFVVLVGPSGCGKSTLLRMVAGLESVNSGAIAIGDKVVNNLPPAKRDIAMVFQSYALYPHKTVAQNMAFALKLRKIDRKIVDERVYTFPPGARNLDSGHQQVQAQIPMATEGTPANDALWVANNDEGFGDYLLYRTYSPSLVVGTQGLQALAWDKSYTESGAMHLQNALPRLAKRKTTERDYTAWLGVRALTDAAMRSGKTTVPDIKAFILSPDFNLEGHKGMALNFRPWDHQMRQPIILGGGTRTIVSKSPQEGFLHEKNVTDTLGYDEPETQCVFK